MKGPIIATLLVITSLFLGCTEKGKEAQDKAKEAPSPSGKEAAEAEQKQIDEITKDLGVLSRGLATAAEMEDLSGAIEPGAPIKRKRCPSMKAPVPQKIEDVESGYVATNDDKNIETFKCAKWEPPKPLKFQINVTGDDKSLKIIGARKLGAKTVEVTLVGTYDASGSLKFGKPEVVRK